MKVLGIAGFSGAGKTTLIERLLPLLVARGVLVSVVKHAHEGFDIDRPGKDSHRHREAGASEVLLTSPRRWVLMHEGRGEAEPSLEAQIGRLSPCDLVIVEGFKRASIPKIEIHRPSQGRRALFESDPNVIAVATDARVAFGGRVLPLDDLEAIALFIMEYLCDGDTSRTAVV